MADIVGGDGPRWMTYVELADLLGIQLEAAKRRAARAKWPHQLHNEDGRARVLVPLNAFLGHRDNVAPLQRLARRETADDAP
jgi:hypothetical protein